MIFLASAHSREGARVSVVQRMVPEKSAAFGRQARTRIFSDRLAQAIFGARGIHPRDIGEHPLGERTHGFEEIPAKLG